MTIQRFQKKYDRGQPLVMVTCYDYTMGCLVAQSSIDALLVGDSAAMVMHGHQTTVPATVDMMVSHVAAVARAVSGTKKMLIADMPFMAHCCGQAEAMSAVQRLMQAGAEGIKIEGASDHALDLIETVTAAGIPVMGHVGLRMQSVHQQGCRVQGREDAQRQEIIADAMRLQQAGCFSIVLECVPSAVAADITADLSVPTIGIGAGLSVSGQILVLQDLLGLNEGFEPQFLKRYLNGGELVRDALNAYVEDVSAQLFPAKEHCYD